MSDFYPHNLVVEDDLPSWAASADSGFLFEGQAASPEPTQAGEQTQQQTTGPEFVEPEMMDEQPHAARGGNLTAKDLQDPTLPSRLGIDARAFHDKFDWHVVNGRWEPRQQSHAAVEQPGDQGIIIQYPGLPGPAIVRATTAHLAEKGVEALTALANSQAQRPQIPIPTNALRDLEGPFDHRAPQIAQQPNGQPVLKQTIVVSKATQAPAEQPAATPAHAPVRDTNQTSARPNRRPQRKVVRNGVGAACLALVAFVPWAYQADSYIETYEDASGADHSLHLIAKIIPG